MVADNVDFGVGDDDGRMETMRVTRVVLMVMVMMMKVTTVTKTMIEVWW